MRKLIRTGNKPVAQICRRLHEKSIIASKPIIQNFCIITQEPNNLVMLNSGIIIKIISLGYS